jgi:hypothetical protein
MVSSFFDKEQDILVVVFVNWAEKSSPVKLEVPGFEVTAWIPYVTSVDSDLGAYASVSAGRIVEIPERSVVTLVGSDHT